MQTASRQVDPDKTPVKESEGDDLNQPARLASFEQTDSKRRFPGNQFFVNTQESTDEVAEELPKGETLQLNSVIQAVFNHYPEIDITLGEIEVARGKYLSAQGSFDQVVDSHGISQPLGFYETNRFGVGFNQPLFNGGELYSTYRIGRGNFEPWFGERETNEAGEFKAGFSIPLLKDSQIDKRRAKLFGADFMIDRTESDVDSRILLIRRFATQVYWEWVASGAAVRVQQRLLELAQNRVDKINIRVEKGDLADLAKIDNDRFIAKRKNDLIKARRMLEKSAIKLSIFWRNQNGNPIVANGSQVPDSFPKAFRIEEDRLNQDIAKALAVRPEFNVLNAEREKTLVDLGYANNLTLPKLDLKGFAGQDIGGLTSSKGDKQPLELQIGVLASVPLQRREGLGKIQQAQGKLAQIDGKIQLTGDKIKIEVQDAASAVNAAFDSIIQSRENVKLALESLRLGNLQFDKGNIDLISLNIYETSVAAAQLQLLEAQLKFFIYQAIYENAIRANAQDDQP